MSRQRLSKANSEMADTFKKTGVIIPAVDRLLLMMSSQEQPDRDMSFLHTTELINKEWCARRAVYRLQGDATALVEPTASASLMRVYEEGHNIHKKWQGWIRKAPGIGLHGDWMCRDCGGMTRDTFTLDHGGSGTCANCGSENTKYKEVFIHVPDLRVTSRADGLVSHDGKFSLLEIKSIGIMSLKWDSPDLFYAYQNGDKTLDQVWWSVKSPFPKHLLQANFYVYLLHLMSPGADWLPTSIRFIYEFKANQQCKEFEVKYTPELVESIVDRVTEANAALDNDVLPDRPEWASIVSSEVCKSCEYRETCFPTTKSAESGKKLVVGVKKADAKRRRRAVS